MNAFAYGAIGFIGYEAIRLYQLFRLGQNQLAWAYPRGKIAVYIFLILVVAAFSGTVAHAFNLPDPAKSLYLGYSVPCGLKHIMGSRKGGSGQLVDDTSTKRISRGRYVFEVVREYFSI